MQIIENISAAGVHVPKAYIAPGELRTWIAPGETIRFDFDRFVRSKPDAARTLQAYVRVSLESEARELVTVVPEPVVAPVVPPQKTARGKKTTARTDAYAGLTEAEALDLISFESDVTTLTEWRGFEDRDVLRNALDSRLASVKI